MNILNKELDIFNDPDFGLVSMNAKNLLSKMLVRNPSNRISTKAVLEHPWFENSD
jgi:serine/threonine protein kinase